MTVPPDDSVGLIERETIGEFAGVSVKLDSKTAVLSIPSGGGKSRVSDAPSVL